jgi:hypothetical protein
MLCGAAAGAQPSVPARLAPTAESAPVKPAADGPTAQPFAAAVEQALSRDGLGTRDDSGCPKDASIDARVLCLLAWRYRGSGSGLELALRLYNDHGNVAGVERSRVMDGGFRGRIQLVPSWPQYRNQRHLAAIIHAHDAIEHTLTGLRAHSALAVRYRHRGIVYRFCRSLGRTTPSAYASGWSIGYNVSGSLNVDEAAILTTITHEIFHLNDEDERFGPHELSAIHAAIVARCGSERRCLASYSPIATTVRGGTYYSFQSDNGDAVDEYAAELASRYLQEQRSMLDRGKLRAPAFKCLAPENAQAYAKIAVAYFGGVDLTPACGP